MAMEVKLEKLSNLEKNRLKDRLDEELEAMNGGVRKKKIRDEDIRIYNWREPDKFSKQQLSTLTMLFDTFSRDSSSTLTSLLQTTCEVEVASVDQKPFQEVIKNMSEITTLNLVSMKPLEGQAILEISPETVQNMIFRVFGGEAAGANIKPKDLTMIERGVIRRIVNELLKVLSDCFQNLDTFEMNLDRTETNPQFIQQLAPPMEICVKVGLQVKIANSKEQNYINIILPFLMLESILPKLTSSSVWLSKVPNRNNKDIIKEQIEQNLHTSNVDFKAEIGKTTLSLHDVDLLDVGDVLVLDTRIDEPIQCFVENKNIAIGKAGTYKNKLAVTIEKIIE